MESLIPPANIVEMRSLPEFYTQAVALPEQWLEHVEAWRTHQESLWAHYWMLGSIAASLVTKYGESDVRRFASEVQCSSALVYERAATHKAWRGKQPDPVLSYTHHVIAAKTPDPQATLELARTENLSTRQLEARTSNKPYEPYKSAPITVPTPELSRRLEFWKSHIKTLPCLICEHVPTEYAHFQGLVNPKTGQLESRRHELSDWCGLPLCPEHHRTGKDSIHAVGETAFFELFGGHEAAVMLWSRFLVEWLST